MRTFIGSIILLLCVSGTVMAAPPANDNFANAAVWTATAFGTTVDASAEPGEPAHAGATAQRSVWWSYTPAADGLIEISTFGSAIDTTLGVYTGASLGALTGVAANDDHSVTVPQSRVLFPVVSGTTYLIAVDGFGGQQGAVRLDIKSVVPPPNDLFANAADLGNGLGATGTISNIGASAESGEPSHGGQLADVSLWWKWTAPSNGVLTVDTVGSEVDTTVAVYIGAAVNALTELAANDDAPGLSGASRVSLEVVAGQVYHIAVDAFAGLEGNHTVNVSLDDAPLVPANNDFASAAIISGPISASIPATNVNATAEVGEPLHAGQASSHTVWWSWTPIASGPATITTAGSTFDTVMGVYTGATVNALTQIAANDDINSNVTQSQTTFAATAYTTYYFAVGGFQTASGTIQLNLAQIPAAPSNDHFANRANLGSELGNGPFTVNLGATAELDEPPHAGKPASKSVWWEWTAPIETLMILTLEDSGDLDTRVAVYTGTSLNNLVALYQNDDRAPGDVTSQIEFRTTPGTTYFIAVDTNDGTAGEIFMTFSEQLRPENDDFEFAEVVTGSSVVRNGYSFNASAEVGEPSHLGFPAAHSLWWSWTAPEDALFKLSTSSSDYDTRLAVYTGTALNALTLVAANDNEPALGQPFSELYFHAVTGTTYHFALDGATEGEFQLVLGRSDFNTGNDNFASRVDLGNAGSVTASGTNLGSTAEGGEPSHRGSSAAASIWWQWTAPANGYVSLNTDGSNFALRAAVYTGSDIGSLTPVTNAGSTGDITSYLFHATVGTTYLIAVDSAAAAQGSVVMSISPGVPPTAPGNDHFADRQILAGDPLVGVETGDNTFATAEASEPAHGGLAAASSLWYQWSAPYSGTVKLDSSVAPFLTRMAVYTGSALASLSPVTGTTASDDTEIEFNAVAGTVYQIAIDAYGTFPAGGEIVFSIFYPLPANDDFADAVDLGNSLPASASGRNVLASAEGLEPSHGGQAPSASVWWNWTAAADGLVTISTAGSTFDTVLGVYVALGTDLLSLTYVGDNDNINGGTTASAVTFQATSGTTYQIAVDGFQGAAGLISLSIEAASPPGAPANDLFANAANLGDGHSVSITSSSANSTPEIDEPNHAGASPLRSVWWKWTAPVSTTVTVDTLGSSFDTILGVYTGATLAGLVEVGANDDTDGGTVQSTVEFTATAGTEYLIAVDGFAGAAGTVHLNLGVSAPANDFFSDRTAIGNGSFVDVTGSNAGATTEPTEPSHAGAPPSATIWWTWTAPASSAFAINVTSGAVDTVLAVYSGSPLGSLSLIRSNNDASPTDTGSHVAFNASAGMVYQIAVGSAPGAGTGAVRLIIQPTTLAPTPANDNFGAASNLYSAYASTVNATNAGATAESGEPGHGGAIARDSIWWEWTAPFAGSVTFDTQGSAIDTRLAVYTGNALASLTLIAGNDDAASGVTYSSVSFAVTAGTRYQIAVDGFIAAEGPLVLRLQYQPSPQLAGYATWISGTIPPNSPASAYSLTADNNSDGFPNGIAYLLGAAGDARPSGSVNVELQGANVIVRYPRGQGVPTGFESLQGSPDLSSWSKITEPGSQFLLIPGEIGQPDTMQVTVPLAAGHSFFRLAVGD